jgi:hypothetical protein
MPWVTTGTGGGTDLRDPRRQRDVDHRPTWEHGVRAAVREVADAVGRGILAGAVGTAAMTLSSSIEAKLSGRGSSSTPAEAVSEATGVEVTDES